MKKIVFSVAAMVLAFTAAAQKPDPFDFGKMWTFENPPTEWFTEAYNFTPDDQWYEDVRKSSLRFATWCSASFVSPHGLMMTNHHCSRGELEKVQHDGENLDATGFYAPTRAEERRSPGLFVEQLWLIEDITAEVKAAEVNAENEADRNDKVQQAILGIQERYTEDEAWQGLRQQVVTFHNGASYSLYGYKRYDDIRLVFIPELDIGNYGGDPDNFTYPRYNLDCTFWRVYDEHGEPLNTEDFYFKFNTDGIAENTPVFVIGNPGSTERYRTVSQLEFDRDFRYPVITSYVNDRYALMEEEYARNPSFELQEEMFSYLNSIKAYKGMLDGLRDARLFKRKVEMEKYIRQSSEHQEYWEDLTRIFDALGPYYPELQFMAPNPATHGATLALLYMVYDYLQLAEDDPESEDLGKLTDEIVSTAEGMQEDDEQNKLSMVLRELNTFADPGDTYITEMLDGRSPDKAAADILEETCFVKKKKLRKLLEKPEKALKDDDPVFKMANLFIPVYYAGGYLFHSTYEQVSVLEEKVSQEVFKAFGDDLPPEATFTLRISDGVVKSYTYNGTVAPIKTTFFGLYDRYYSNDGNAPWALPERWANPPMELLQAPFNFVSTNDTVGGNSGSPVINEKKEAVGLSFDGNIESLPGNFIFDTETNRSVSVHSGGIVAALQHIYHAQELVDELLN